jgi:hypothetical protein
MGWQLINTVVKAITGENEIVQSVGYMFGDDNEDGYYCFHRGPYHAEKPFIAEEFCPHIDFDGYSYFQTGFLFNDRPVFKNTNSGYIFYSKKENAWIGGLQDSAFSMMNIREPYYYTDLDEVTVKGDVFYKGNFPELNGGQVLWTKSGSSEYPSMPATKAAEIKQDFWEWYNNGSINQERSGLCGKYQNANDGSWKYVGIPTYLAYTQQGSQSYYTGEIFTRSFEKDARQKFTYEGDKGHTIAMGNGGVWLIGQAGHGKWSECNDEPSLVDEIQFTGYQIEEGTGNIVRDANGDFILEWNGMVLGNKKKPVLMGEVSLWRSEIE